MGKFEKLHEQILSGNSDSNIRFEDLRSFLKNLGFEERIKKESVLSLFNLTISPRSFIPPKVDEP